MILKTSTCVLTPVFVLLLLSRDVVQISLMPRHSSLEMFNAGDPASNSRKQSYERYRCHEGAKSVSRSLLSSTCSQLISSMSAVINDGALRESSPSSRPANLQKEAPPWLTSADPPSGTCADLCFPSSL